MFNIIFIVILTFSVHAWWVTSVVSNSLWPYDFCSPGSSVHGILQAKILECVAFSSSRVSSLSRDWTCVSDAYLHWPAGCFCFNIPHKRSYGISLSLIHFTLHCALKRASVLLQIYFLPFLWWICMYVCMCACVYTCIIFFYPYIHQ